MIIGNFTNRAGSVTLSIDNPEHETATLKVTHTLYGIVQTVYDGDSLSTAQRIVRSFKRSLAATAAAEDRSYATEV